MNNSSFVCVQRFVSNYDQAGRAVKALRRLTKATKTAMNFLAFLEQTAILRNI
jgi:hypothetical protein